MPLKKKEDCVTIDREKAILTLVKKDNPLSRAAAKLFLCAKKIYLKVYSAQVARHVLQYYRHKFSTPFLSSGTIASQNALTARRNNEEACSTARLASPPALWPQIDISVVLHNSEKWIPIFFDSLLKQSYPLSALSVTFVDNASKDSSCQIVQDIILQHASKFAGIQLMKQENVGYGGGNHAAIEQGSSQFCIVTNVDLEFYDNTLRRLVQTALSDTNGIIASWEARQAPHEHPKHYDPVTLESEWSSHACILMRRDAYEKVGGYDKSIFMYGEDV